MAEMPSAEKKEVLMTVRKPSRRIAAALLIAAGVAAFPTVQNDVGWQSGGSGRAAVAGDVGWQTGGSGRVAALDDVGWQSGGSGRAEALDDVGWQ
ncbi:hypothetical protein GCM10010329_38080 [Streptomyces spiroverticillatus]|uniref:Uncharacterized protein n=2 Tax=Streptomyces finlayi TaxID=67296 RepID=A0A918WYC0_9ACTN|nr:hypothetical protein GCM10010329_38080 [Streptomyces spiroverticillatus]GHC94950.1 hypothetical protein GCM10010334_33530 [Streptomyces finlayi]